ncbi:hypothetical protein ASPCAL05926 [Aspergillus calidoustus]|uniref:Uncharacterized protein n=1 Tax=Aspergillus calidoustus TaxID=454130 RepID=A0A0U5FYX9_ASPCI|nr:hypothetical protein ASPCAL05926 [Aspergillus calidoustus]
MDDDDLPLLESDFDTDFESDSDMLLTPTSSISGERPAPSSSAPTAPTTDETPAFLQVQITLPPRMGRWILWRRRAAVADIQLRFTEDRKWVAYTLVGLWTGAAFLSYGVLVSMLVRGFKTYCSC